MNVVPVPLDTVRNLPPGSYFLELDAGEAALAALNSRPDLTRSIVAGLASQIGPGVTYAGSGIAWSVASGGAPRRVYAVRLDVAQAVTVEAGLGAWVRGIVAVLIAAGIFVGGVSLYRMEPAAIPEVVDRVKDTARSVRDVALLAGGLTVAYIVARRAGWIA